MRSIGRRSRRAEHGQGLLDKAPASSNPKHGGSLAREGAVGVGKELMSSCPRQGGLLRRRRPTWLTIAAKRMSLVPVDLAATGSRRRLALWLQQATVACCETMVAVTLHCRGRSRGAIVEQMPEWDGEMRKCRRAKGGRRNWLFVNCIGLTH